MENEPWYKKCIRCKNRMFGICMADVTIKQFAENGSICPLWEEKTMEYKSPCKDCKWHDVFWKGAGCTLLNNMEPCHFEAKDTNVSTKSEMEEEDDG